LPSCGGGAQVVFNDIEVLRQESPTGVGFSPSRKRHSSGAAGILGVSPYVNPSLFEENVEAVVDRCATGIVHTSVSKRSRHN